MADEQNLLERVAFITGWSDGEIAELIGVGRSTVQAQRSGRLPINVTDVQKKSLIFALKTYARQVAEDVEEFELFA